MSKIDSDHQAYKVEAKPVRFLPFFSSPWSPFSLPLLPVPGPSTKEKGPQKGKAFGPKGYFGLYLGHLIFNLKGSAGLSLRQGSISQVNIFEGT